MDRTEMCMVETYKVEELKKKLKPVTDWSRVKEGRLIYHNNDNNIFNINRFSEYNKEDNMIWYKNKDELLYNMSATGWYYYDESIADEVEEMFTPKLYELDGLMTVAFNKKDAFKSFKEKYKNIVFDDECECINNINQISEVDDFRIELK